MESVIIKKAKNGMGAFAARGFKKDEVITLIGGSLRRYEELLEKGGRLQDNSFRFDQEMYLYPDGEVGDFLNHSCEPNARVEKRDNKIYVVEITGILEDEEVAIDYSTILAEDDIWEMDCNCDTPICRGKIARFNQLPQELQEKYKALGIVPQYILDIKEEFD